MSALSEKLRRGRELKIEAGVFVFTANRPTDVDMIRLNASADTGTRSAMLASWVTGWAKKDGSPITEIDLGVAQDIAEPFPIAFDPEACADFLFDNVVIFQIVAEAMTGAYAERMKASGEASKN